MGIIRKSIVLSKTIRNVGRLREIVTVFAKNGFDEFMSLGITSKIPNFVLPKSAIKIKDELKEKQELDWSKILGHRLRLSFEELGPAFVKFGQLISTREDIFEPGLIEEMKILRDKVRPISYEQAKEAIERSLKSPVEQVFSHIDPNPIGMASIGVVFSGVLKNGDDVVIKVRRPNIEKIIETDFSLMLFIVSQIEKASEEVRALGLGRVLNDFSIGLQNELNFYVEALNCEKLKYNMLRHNQEGAFYIPKIYKEYSTDEMIVMEKIKGIPFSSPKIMDEIANGLEKKLDLGIRVFIKTFLQDGLFHADLHGGNFFLMTNGAIGVVDFGLVGNLGKKSRQNFLAIIYALVTYNYENLVYEFLDVAEFDDPPDVDELIHDVRSALSPFVGLTVQQTNFTQLVQALINALTKHKIFLPRDWFIVFRAFITLDGVGRSLGLDFDIFGIFEKDIMDIVKHNFNKDQLLEEGVWAARDVLPMMRLAPRHLKWFLKDWSKKGFAFQVRHMDLEAPAKKIQSGVLFLGLSLLVAVFIFSGVALIGPHEVHNSRDIPTLSWIFWGLALAFFLRSMPYLKK